MGQLGLAWTPALNWPHYILENACRDLTSGKEPKTADERRLVTPRSAGGPNFMTEPNSILPPALATGPSRQGPLQTPTARRSLRVAIDMPVEVVAQSLDGEAFRQDTRTAVVSAQGALLVLATTIEIKPSILLINKKTGGEAQCRVAYQKRIESGRVQLGIEFVDPQPRFWRIAFPPDNWSRADRKMPASPSK